MLDKYNDIIISVDSFNELTEKIKDFDNKEKGDIFELLTKYIFLLHPNFINITKNIYLYNDISIKIKGNNKLSDKDKGIDLILETIDGEFYPIQCKFRLDTKIKISWGKLATFVGQSFGIAEFKKGIYITNTFDIDEEILKSDKIDLIYGDFFDTLNKEFFDNIRNTIKGKELFYKSNELWDHQRQFIKKSIKYFEDNDRGTAIMACGVGKTYSALKLDKEMGNHLTLILVPSLYLLSQIFNEWAREYCLDPDVKFILVGSDCDIDDNYKANGIFVTTDEKNIKTKLNKYTNEYEKVIIISTYQSSDKLKLALKKKTIDLIIYDEAHKTVGSNGIFQFALYDENIKAHLRLFLTATPRIYGNTKKIKNEDDNDFEIVSMDNENIYGKQYFSYNIRDAIDNGILCEYEVLLMCISTEQLEQYKISNKLINVNNDTMGFHYLATAMMINNMFNKKEINHLLTYHSTIKNSKDFKSLLIDIVDKKVDVNQIDGNDSAKRKNDLIRDFKRYDKSVLTSAKVLNEGVNIPIIDSVCFVESRNSAIDIVQCVGRALRKYDGKKKASIIIPVIENELDKEGKFDNLIKIIKNLGEYDQAIKEYFLERNNDNIINKKFSIRVINYENNNVKCGIKLDLKAVYDKINTIVLDSVYAWDTMLNKVIKYIDENGKRPLQSDNNLKNKQMAYWIDHQLQNYKKNKQNMINKNTKEKWEIFIINYNKYFLLNEDKWFNNLKKAMIYIDTYKKRPSCHSKNKEINNLAKWLDRQNNMYDKKIQAMKDDKIQLAWKKFIINYKQYFLSNEELWFNKLIQLEEYIKKYNKRPSQKDLNNEIKQLGYWISDQLINYEKKIQIMNNNNICERFEIFLNDYKKYFLTNEDEWKNILIEVILYIKKYNKKPSDRDKDQQIKKLGRWICTQIKNYKDKKYIMKDPLIYKLWEEFIKEYEQYFSNLKYNKN
jgi:superfamily II DNA or RNA helicase